MKEKQEKVSPELDGEQEYETRHIEAKPRIRKMPPPELDGERGYDTRDIHPKQSPQ